MIRVALVAWFACVVGGEAPAQLGFFGSTPDEGKRPRREWVVAPPRDGPMTAKDRLARKGLVDLIEENQTEEFRKLFQVDVPDEPTGLPDDYDILIYGSFKDILLLRLQIQIRGSTASGELVTADGFKRGSLPVAKIDDLARQLSYAFQSRKKRRVGTEDVWVEGIGSISGSGRERRERIELISRDPARPFHLRTEAWALNTWRIDGSTYDVASLAHTRVGEAVEELAREKLKRMEPSADLGREVVERLRRIEASQPSNPARGTDSEDESPGVAADSSGFPSQLPLDDPFRDDLPSVEALLYARLAVYLRLREALPELRRLGLEGAERRLQIVTADDPTELLKEALLVEITEDDIAWWAEQYARQLPSPKDADVLLYGFFHVPERCLYVPLKACDLNKEHLSQLHAFYAQAEDLHAKVAAAQCLLDKTHRDEYYRFLVRLAGRNRPYSGRRGSFQYAPEDAAQTAILSYAVDHGRERHATTQMIRTRLAQIPFDKHGAFNGMDRLIATLGDLGGKEDLELLAKYCAGRHEIASTAIIAIAKIDHELALEKARDKVRKYLTCKDKTDHFDWAVEPYFGLFLWKGQRSDAALLEASLARYRREIKDAGLTWGEVHVPWIAETETLIAFLKAETVDERLKHALAYKRMPFVLFQGERDRDEWVADVGRRLIRDGADPKQCEPLLRPAWDATAQFTSREGISWAAEYSP
jgi:hypothetical protein